MECATKKYHRSKTAPGVLIHLIHALAYYAILGTLIMPAEIADIEPLERFAPLALQVNSHFGDKHSYVAWLPCLSVNYSRLLVISAPIHPTIISASNFYSGAEVDAGPKR
jgi:hypothetical protein